MQHYKEIEKESGSGGNGDDIPFDIDNNITEIDTGKIDTDYMNRMFTMYLKSLTQKGISEQEKNLNELHKPFAFLSQEEQKIANYLLHGIQSGDIILENNKTLYDYITEYQQSEKEDTVKNICTSFGLDANLLRDLLSHQLNTENLNDFERFTKLKETVDKQKAKTFFEPQQKKTLSPLQVTISIDRFLKDYLLQGKVRSSDKRLLSIKQSSKIRQNYMLQKVE